MLVTMSNSCNHVTHINVLVMNVSDHVYALVDEIKLYDILLLLLLPIGQPPSLDWRKNNKI